MLRRLIFILFITGLLPACASITGRHQYVKIVPPSQNTEIYVKDKAVAKGPSVIKIRRGKAPQIKFRRKGNYNSATLDTDYRWGQSFAGNLFLITWAPLGWLIDYMTGSSWHINDYFATKKTPWAINSYSRIAIVPSNHSYESTSDRLSNAVEKIIRRNFPQATIIDFEDSLETFNELGMDHNYQGDLTLPEENNVPLARLSATHFVTSEYDEKAKKVKVDIISGYSNKKVKSKTFTYKQRLKPKGWKELVLRELFSFFPNTLSMGYNETQYFFDIVTPTTYYASTRDRSPWDIFKSISLTNVTHYRKRRPWRVRLRFFPDVSLSLNDILFDELNAERSEIELEWNFLNVGYGLRASFSLPIGEFFIEGAPFASLNYYKISAPNFSKTAWEWDNGYYTAFGFDTWVSSRWNLRIISRGQSLGNRFQGADELIPGSRFTDDRIITFVGINIGYYFFEERRKVRKLFFN